MSELLGPRKPGGNCDSIALQRLPTRDKGVKVLRTKERNKHLRKVLLNSPAFGVPDAGILFLDMTQGIR